MTELAKPVDLALGGIHYVSFFFNDVSDFILITYEMWFFGGFFA